MSTKHTGSYCIHKDKQCLTKQEACDAVKSMALKGRGADRYKCKHCGMWHTAHRQRVAVRDMKRRKSALKAAVLTHGRH